MLRARPWLRLPHARASTPSSSNWAVADGEPRLPRRLHAAPPGRRGARAPRRRPVPGQPALGPARRREAVHAPRHPRRRTTPRGACVLDLLGNLIKEGLGERLPELRARSPPGASASPSASTRSAATTRDDARTWRLLQRLRRLDRAWQRHVRRRPYPFLLPGPVRAPCVTPSWWCGPRASSSPRTRTATPTRRQLLEWHPARDHPPGARVALHLDRGAPGAATRACLLSRPFWMWGAEMGTNEDGVTIGNEAVFTREPVRAASG